jgi:uncharacterized protein (DUF1778 family)
VTDKGTSRLVIRIPHADAVLIASAAAMANKRVSEFVIEAAIDRAKRILKQK